MKKAIAGSIRVFVRKLPIPGQEPDVVTVEPPVLFMHSPAQRLGVNTGKLRSEAFPLMVRSMRKRRTKGSMERPYGRLSPRCFRRPIHGNRVWADGVGKDVHRDGPLVDRGERNVCCGGGKGGGNVCQHF